MGPGVFGIIYIKSMASKLVDPHEQGRIFSLLGTLEHDMIFELWNSKRKKASAEVFSQSMSPFIYGSILKATIFTMPSFSYIALGLVLSINLILYQ